MNDLEGARLRAGLDHVLGDLSAPSTLSSGVLERGGRLRRRRRAAVLTGGALLAGVVVAGGLAIGTGGTDDVAGGFAGDATPDTTSPSTAYTAPATQPTYVDLDGWWDTPGRLLLSRLARALPDDVTIVDSRLRTPASELAPGQSNDEFVGELQAVLDGPRGTGRIEMFLKQPQPSPRPEPVSDGEPSFESQTTCPASDYDPVPTQCHELGAPGVVGRVLSSPEGDLTFNVATLIGPDGGLVYIAAWNGTGFARPEDGAPSAAEPPLTLGQLRKLVRDPTWTSGG